MVPFVLAIHDFDEVADRLIAQHREKINVARECQCCTGARCLG